MISVFNKKTLNTAIQILNDTIFHRYAVVHNNTLYVTDEKRLLAIKDKDRIVGSGWISIQNLKAILSYMGGITDVVYIEVVDWLTRVHIDHYYYYAGSTAFEFLLPKLCEHPTPRSADKILEAQRDLKELFTINTSRTKLPKAKYIIFDANSNTFREVYETDSMWYQHSYVDTGLKLFPKQEVTVALNSKSALFIIEPTTGSFYAVAPMVKVNMH